LSFIFYFFINAAPINDTTDTDDGLIEQYIDMGEEERTEMAKRETSNARRVAIDAAH
jgi:hypothetical protein